MTALGRLGYLRPCQASDDAFLYAVFSTTWESEVAALPNQNLAQHVLRIQHIAQERRFAGRFPDYERYVVRHEGQDAGRLYVHQSGLSVHVVDLTLMPEFRCRGIGTRLLRDLLEGAAHEGLSVTLRVERRNRRAAEFYTRLGFALTDVDDLDNHFEWTPVSAPSAMKEDMREDLVDMREDLVGMREDLVGMRESELAD